MKRKAKRAYRQSELYEQILVVRWFKLRFPALKRVFFHIPNGQNVGMSAGKRLKDSGVVAGIPDLFLSVPRFAENGEISHGLYIEMKSRETNGRVQPHQKEVHDDLKDKGYQVEVCWSFDEARIVIQRYLA